MDGKNLGSSEDLVPDKEFTTAIVRRRHAIQLFLNNPEEAIQLYPELESDLISFFLLSTNPNTNLGTGMSLATKEKDFLKWELAREWADAHVKKDPDPEND